MYLNILFYIIISIMIAFALIWKYQDGFHKRFFSRFWGYIYRTYHDDLKEEKRAHFNGIRRHTSADPRLRKQGVLRILEIGAGPGANFEFLPPGCNLTVLEMNKFFFDAFKKNQVKYPMIKMGRFVVGMAEDMKEIESNSIDVVVSTLVLCSVTSIEQTLKEVQRVLAPGGKYFYWEHIHAEKGTWTRIVQNMFYGTLYECFFGCNITRNSHKLLAKDPGFSHVEQTCFYHNFHSFLGFPHLFTFLIGYTVKGVATVKKNAIVASEKYERDL